MSHDIATAFDVALHDVETKGSLTHDDIRRRCAPNVSTVSVPSLEKVEFYADFACEPAIANERSQREREEAMRIHGRDYVEKILRDNKHHPWRRHRQYDFQLTDEEKKRLQDGGMMVSKRLGSHSFADIYYRLYTDDLPVFVTSDSILRAWHRSFDAILSNLEVRELMPLLGATLSKALLACARQLDALVDDHWTLRRLLLCQPSTDRVESEVTQPFNDTGDQVAKTALAHVELFLAVAHRLLLKDTHQAQEPAEQQTRHKDLRRRLQQLDAAYEASLGKPTRLHARGNKDRLATMLQMIQWGQLSTVTVFGSPRDVDFSFFKPRGHYTKSDKLKRYFRAMTWLGTIDFRITGADEGENVFQLQCACMLVHVLRQANVLTEIQTLHETIAALTGDGVGVDSMTPKQLHELIGDRDVMETYFGANAIANLCSLQDDIINRGFGKQTINGHPTVMTEESRPSQLPTAFAIIGQQFVWSEFIFSKLVFDQVMDDGKKVPRRMTSGIDVAFALFSE